MTAVFPQPELSSSVDDGRFATRAPIAFSGDKTLYAVRPGPSGSVSANLGVPTDHHRRSSGQRRISPRRLNAFLGGRTSCDVSLGPRSPVSANSWELNLPPGQNQNPSIQRSPIPVPPRGMGAFPGGRTSCDVRVRIAVRGFNTKEAGGPRRAPRRWIAVNAPVDTEMANNTLCDVSLRPRNQASATSWKLNLTPSQNQNPSIQRGPIPVPPLGLGAFPGGRTSCDVRVRIAVRGFNTKEAGGPRRARRRGIAAGASADTEMANNTLCDVSLKPSNQASATSWKLNLPPGQNQSPASQRRPIPESPGGQNAIPGGRSPCALRNRTKPHEQGMAAVGNTSCTVKR